MNLHINEGDRPSMLDLDRLATGELPDAEADAMRARLGPRDLAHLEAVERARDHVASFDAEILRKRAARLDETPTRRPERARRPWWQLWLPALAVACLALFMIGRAPQSASSGIRAKGQAELTAYQLREGLLVPYQGERLGAGDVVGFQVRPAQARAVTVLSVDGTGKVSVFWPAHGDAPEEIPAGGQVPLPGSITLDDARGPEVFVAVFGERSVGAVRAQVEQVAASGGVEALVDWAARDRAVDAVRVERR